MYFPYRTLSDLMVDEWDAATEAAVTVEACEEAEAPASSPDVEVEAAGSADKSPRERSALRYRLTHRAITLVGCGAEPREEIF